METFHLHGLQMPPKKCLYAKRKCIPVVSSNAECRSTVCRMCPFSEELHNVTALNRRESFAWWGRWAPRLCHLTRLLLEGGGSVYKQRHGDILELTEEGFINTKSQRELQIYSDSLGKFVAQWQTCEWWNIDLVSNEPAKYKAEIPQFLQAFNLDF